MKRAAIGVRMHSGWGILVAVAEPNLVVARRRIEILPAGGIKQPYHHAAEMELDAAGRFLTASFSSCQRMATDALREAVGALAYEIRGCAMLLSSARPLPPLPRILASHPLIHTAEGEFYRDAVRQACIGLNIQVHSFVEKELTPVPGLTVIGPPWASDHKLAAAAALQVLKRNSGVT
jgi:hypothetical protein